MSAAGASATAAVGNVVVKFFTTTSPHTMPPQSYSIPLTTLPEGLQKLVDSVLEVDPAIPYDFLFNDEFIGTSLERFLRRRRISLEEVLEIEYTPAMQAQEGSKIPHDDWVSSIRAPQCGNASVLLTAAYDHCVRLWSNEECLAIGSKHTEAVKEVALHPHAVPSGATAAATSTSKRRKRDSDVAPLRFVSGGKDGRLVAWEYAQGTIKSIGLVQPHVGSIDTVDVSPDGKLVASGSWDAAVKVFAWETVLAEDVAAEKKAPVVAFTDHVRGVLSCRFSPTTAGKLYSTGLDGTIKAWDVEAATLLGTLPGDHAIQRLSVKPVGGGGDLILAGSTDNRIRLYDSRQKTIAKTFSGHRQWVYGVSWLWRSDEDKDSNLFASTSEDATVRVWDLRSTSNALVTLDTMHTDGVLDVCYVGNSEIASGGKDNKTKTFSLQQETL